MQDKLTLVKRITAEHQAIKGHVKLVGDSVSDNEALAALQKAHTDFIPGRLEIVSEKQKKLQQTMSTLEEGLKNHFAFEEKALPPLLGELLMQALVLEHSEIKDEINQVKSAVADSKLEELSREELLSRESQIQQMIDNICQLIEEHATKEEAVLEMLQKALEEKER
jgi:hemerythrin